MDIVSPLVCRHAPRVVARFGWVVIAWLVLVLLVAVAQGIAGHVPLQAPDPLLSPFRWEALDPHLT